MPLLLLLLLTRVLLLLLNLLLRMMLLLRLLLLLLLVLTSIGLKGLSHDTCWRMPPTANATTSFSRSTGSLPHREQRRGRTGRRAGGGGGWMISTVLKTIEKVASEAKLHALV
jgi:hypothetical protein